LTLLTYFLFNGFHIHTIPSNYKNNLTVRAMFSLENSKNLIKTSEKIISGINESNKHLIPGTKSRL
jgi:hypothetical protein